MPSQFLKQSKNTQRVDMPAGNLAGRIEAGRPLETPAATDPTSCEIIPSATATACSRLHERRREVSLRVGDHFLEFDPDVDGVIVEGAGDMPDGACTVFPPGAEFGTELRD
jgi:hypothetical protein